MLYIGGMNKNLNVPDEIWFGKKEYSFRVDNKVNGWLCWAALISGASDLAFIRQIAHLPVAWRCLIALAPFLAILLWAWNLARWIRGMDELHQRITLATILFTVSATFFCVLLWQRLDKAGFFQAIFPSAVNPGALWDIGTVGSVFVLLLIFYVLGHFIFNRRYQ